MAGVVEEYLLMLKNDPERYRRMLDANRGNDKRKPGDGEAR